MGTPLRNDLVASAIYPSVIEIPAENEKDEEIFVEDAQQPTTLRFADLPNEILVMIFQRAIFGKNGQTDLKALDGIRNMGSRYYNILENLVLEPLWIKLQTALSKTEEIPNPIIQTSFNTVNTQVSAKLGAESAVVESHILSKTYFTAFCQLHQNLKEKDVFKTVNLSLGVWEYKEMHRKINNIALKTVWDCIKNRPFFQHPPFQQEHVEGEQMSKWLNDPQYMEGIATSVGGGLSCGGFGFSDINVNIPIFPIEIAKFSHLEYLSINKAKLTAISEMAFDNLGRFTQLRHLIIFDNEELTSLPDSINKLTRLQVLNLGRNGLTDLPSTFGELTQLQFLSVQENRLAHFPNVITQLPQLQNLALHGNRLTAIPPTVSNLTELRAIYLHGNRLTSIPSTMTNLTHLGENTGIGMGINTHPLTLFGNPLIFLLDENLYLPDKPVNPSFGLPPLPAQAHMNKYLACSTYPCQMPLATLCKQIHLNADNDDLLQKFEELPSDMKQSIRQKLGSVSTQASSLGTPWSPTDDLLADKARFVNAVMIMAHEKFHALSPHEKGLVYRWVMILAGQLTQELDEQWAQTNYTVHPFEVITAAKANSIRLIEAMELVFSGQFPPTLSLQEPEVNASN